ncbi:hypothetical protein [Candidatus Pelagibacter sp. HIMB1782]|uniref:hypothetical protein n=1 Tax=Candidatus Pelagibacter sp. HIMB1782 TaxID=3413375 RepID=UPI003F82AF6D
MKKLFSTFLVLTLLVSETGYANIVDLYCKYTEGHITGKIPYPFHEDTEKNTQYLSISQSGFEDYKIKLDTKKEKIVEAPKYSSDGSTYMFGDNLIFWYALPSSESRLEIKFTLNRYTGRLTEDHKNYKYGDTENNYWMSLIYDCSLTKKLF